MKLSNGQYEEIKKIVAMTYKKFNVRCVPISGYEIAVKMGIKILPYSAYPLKTQALMLLKSEDGFSIKRKGQWYLFYNDNDGKSYGRINNTIMHEVGHIVLDHTEESELAEAEANFFAKYALAPPVLIHNSGLREPGEIADFFDISYQAATYALSFYRKWLQYGGRYYKDYEIMICDLFGIAV